MCPSLVDIRSVTSELWQGKIKKEERMEKNKEKTTG